MITVASLVSFKSVPKVNIPGNDKVVHFLFYFILVILWSFAKKKNYFDLKYNLIIVIFAVMYGIIIEVLQSVMTNNREADIYDAIANLLGALVGFFSICCMKIKFFNKFF
ncbi:MAG: VanZ family protein [Flavobacterium sp.]